MWFVRVVTLTHYDREVVLNCSTSYATRDLTLAGALPLIIEPYLTCKSIYLLSQVQGWP
jgi:hypothetical protein